MGHSYAGDAMLWQLIYSCDVSQSVKEIVFWELTEWLRRTHLSKKVKLSCTQRSFSSHLTDSLYTVRNKLLEKYIGILGRVNLCGFMALVAFSLASHCSGWTLGCFSVAHQYHYPDVKTSTDIYASQELHNIHGANKFYTNWNNNIAPFTSVSLCKMNLLFLSIRRPHVL